MNVSRNRFGAAAVLLMFLTVVISVGCGGERESVWRITGDIIEVAPATIDTFESLTVRDESGELWIFGPARITHFTPSHLIEHQAFGDRVTVVYRLEADGSRTVVDIEDASR